jgi:hypothetical protein
MIIRGIPPQGIDANYLRGQYPISNSALPNPAVFSGNVTANKFISATGNSISLLSNAQGTADNSYSQSLWFMAVNSSGGSQQNYIQFTPNGGFNITNDTTGDVQLNVGGSSPYQPASDTGTLGYAYLTHDNSQAFFAAFDSTTGVTHTFAVAFPTGLSGWGNNLQVTQEFSGGTMYFVAAEGSATSMTIYDSTTAALKGWGLSEFGHS